MGRLQCDICGGTLVMQSGGQTAVCDSCGMQYSVERMREKVQEIRGTVSVEGTVRTQDADFIIRGGVLERYNGNDVHVVIPDSVVKIGEKAFEGCAGIQSVTFSPNIMEIGDSAFFDCKSLSNVRFSEKLETIGDNAFGDCCTLKQVNLPETVKTIGAVAFSRCPLIELQLPNRLETIGNHAFYDCKSLIRIELFAKTMGDYAFYGCQSLTEVELSVETIKNSAFQRCQSLTKIRFFDGLKIIGDNAFSDCSSLQHINVPETVKTIGNCAFENCPALYEIIISEKQKKELFESQIWDIFAEKVGEDEYGSPEYSSENCGPWFKNYLEEKHQRALYEIRRRAGKCQYCGGTFTGWLTKKCAQCGKNKDYD